MSSFRARTRFATLVAVGLALLVSGVVAGAAGGNFILGQANSAGTSNTSLTTSSTGNALLVTQNGTGTAIRGSTGSGSGIAGFFTSGSGSGVSGVVGNENSYGVYAGNDSANEGTRRRDARQRQAERGRHRHERRHERLRGRSSPSCDGLPAGGGNGVYGTGYGFAAGVCTAMATDCARRRLGRRRRSRLPSTRPSRPPDIPADLGQTARTAPASQGFGESALSDMSDLTASAGGAFSGFNGVIRPDRCRLRARASTARTNGGFNFALFADGEFAYVDGNFTVTGTCTRLRRCGHRGQRLRIDPQAGRRRRPRRCHAGRRTARIVLDRPCGQEERCRHRRRRPRDEGRSRFDQGRRREAHDQGEPGRRQGSHLADQDHQGPQGPAGRTAAPPSLPTSSCGSSPAACIAFDGAAPADAAVGDAFAVGGNARQARQGRRRLQRQGRPSTWASSRTAASS